MNLGQPVTTYQSMRYWYDRSFIINALWFQGVWALSVLGGQSTTVYVVVLIGLHFALCYRPLHESFFVALAVLPGLAFDSTLTVLGVFQFNSEPSLLPIPMWLIGLWVAFSCTLRHSLKFILARPKLAIVLALMSAPSSYYAGMRLGAVEFPYSVYFSLAIIALGWALLMWWFICLDRAHGQSARTVTPHE